MQACSKMPGKPVFPVSSGNHAEVCELSVIAAAVGGDAGREFVWDTAALQHIDRDIYHRVFHISFPAVAGFLGLIAFDITDIYWIEKLASDAVAGVASASFIVWMLYSVITITGAGCASLVSQFHGGGKRRRCWEAIVQSSWLSLFLSGGLIFVLLPHVDRPFSWMGLEPHAAALAVDYFRIILWGMPIAFLDLLAGNIFNAYGDNRISNGIMLLSLAANMLLDPALMFGWWGFSALGAAGAAWASVISHLLSLVLRGIVLTRRGYIPPLPKFLRFRTFYYRQIIRIGLPNAVTGVIWSVVYPFLTRLITPYGMLPVAAIGICHRIESFPYFTAMALGVAMTTLVGNSLGAGKHDEIDRVLTAGIRVGIVFMLPFLALFLVWPHWVMGLMTDDPALLGHGADYLFIIGFFEIFMGLEMILSGLFTGLGITWPALLVTIPCTVGRVPLAWLLAEQFQLGVTGIWWSISLTTGAKGLGLLVLYHILKKRTGNFSRIPAK